MTKSIKTNENGRIVTVYNGTRSGNEWTQIPDSEWPEATEDNVSVDYHYDGTAVSVETTPIPEGGDLP